MSPQNCAQPQSPSAAGAIGLSFDRCEYQPLIVPDRHYWCWPVFGGCLDELVRFGQCAVLVSPLGGTHVLHSGQRFWSGPMGWYRADLVRQNWQVESIPLTLTTRDGASVYARLSLTCTVRDVFRVLALGEPEAIFCKAVADCAADACLGLTHDSLYGPAGPALLREHILQRLAPRARSLGLHVEDLYITYLRPDAGRLRLLTEREQAAAELEVERRRQACELLRADTESSLSRKKLEMKEAEAMTETHVEQQRARIAIERQRAEAWGEALKNAMECAVQSGWQGYEPQLQALVDLMKLLTGGSIPSVVSVVPEAVPPGGASETAQLSFLSREALLLTKDGYETVMCPQADGRTRLVARREGLTIEIACAKDHPTSPPVVTFSTNGPESAQTIPVLDWNPDSWLRMVVRQVESWICDGHREDVRAG